MAFIGRAARLRAMVGLLCGAWLVASAGCKGEVGKGIETGDQLLFQQKYARAEAVLRKTLKRLDEKAGGRDKQSVEVPEVLDRLGRIGSLYLHNYSQALEDYNRLVNDFPKAKEAFGAQATIADIYHHRLGDLAQAATEYQKLVTRFGDNPESAHYQLSLVELYFSMHNYEQAVHEAERLVQRWPQAKEVARARFDIANVAYVTGQFDKALKLYEELVKDIPDEAVTPLAQFEMASCYQELGDDQKALEVLYLSLKTHPHPQVVQRKIARIQRRIQRTQTTGKIAKEQRRAGVVAKVTKVKKPAAVKESAENGAAEEESTDDEDADSE